MTSESPGKKRAVAYLSDQEWDRVNYAKRKGYARTTSEFFRQALRARWKEILEEEERERRLRLDSG